MNKNVQKELDDFVGVEIGEMLASMKTSGESGGYHEGYLLFEFALKMYSGRKDTLGKIAQKALSVSGDGHA